MSSWRQSYIWGRSLWIAAALVVAGCKGPAVRGQTPQVSNASAIAATPKPFVFQAPTGRPMVVAVVGDYGDPNPAADDVAKLVASWKPDLVATVGDNNYPVGAAETIDANIGKRYGRFIKPYKGEFGAGASDVNRFFPSMGNHDWYTAGAKPYLDWFELPGNERYYDVLAGDVHLFFVNSDKNEPDGTSSSSAQGRWLQRALAASKAAHRWVFFHHPPYNSGRHHAAKRMRWPFKDWGATAVFAGHDHHYERLELNGLPYVVTGHGGRHLYPQTGAVSKHSLVRVYGRYGAMKIVIPPGKAAEMSAVMVGGEVSDRLTLAAQPRPLTAPR